MTEENKAEKMKTPKFDALKDKEKDVINYYIYVKRVKVQAYINGMYPGGEEGKDYNYDSCRTESSKFFANPNIQEAIQEKFEEIWQKRYDYQGKILDELSALAFSNVDKVFDFNDSVQLKDLSKEDTRAIKSIKFRPNIEGGKQEIEKVEIHDKKAALSEMADILGLKRIQVEHSGSQIIYLDKQDESL